MFITMVIAALIVDGLFSALGLIPTGPRPTRADIFSQIQLNYKLVLNVLGFVIFAALFWLTARRGATDPTCGMKVDRDKALIARGRRADLLFLLGRLQGTSSWPTEDDHVHEGLPRPAARTFTSTTDG